MSVLQREWRRLRQSLLARNAGWMLVGQGTGVVLQVAYFVALARLIGATEYGMFVGAFAFAGLVSQYASLGSGTVLLQYVAGDSAAFPRYWGNVLLSCLSTSAVLITGLYFIAPRLLSPSTAKLVIFAAISNCLFAPLTEQTARVFQCFEKMKITALLNLLTNLMRTVTVFCMLWYMHHATALEWAIATTIVSGIAAVIAVCMVMKLYGRPEFAPKLLVRHGLEGFGYSFASSTMSVYNDVDKTMLSHYGMNYANGIYSMAYRVIDMATIPIYSVREAVLPRLFSHGRSGIHEAFSMSMRLLKRVFPLSVLIAIILFIAAPLIPHIAGKGFSESILALRWLCLIPVLRSIHIMIGSVLTGAGLQHYRTAAQIVAAAFNLAANLWFIPRFGWHGAAWTSLMTDAALCLLTWGVLFFIAFRHKVKGSRTYAN